MRTFVILACVFVAGCGTLRAPQTHILTPRTHQEALQQMAFRPDCAVMSPAYIKFAQAGLTPEQRAADPDLDRRKNLAVATVVACDFQYEMGRGDPAKSPWNTATQ